MKQCFLVVIHIALPQYAQNALEQIRGYRGHTGVENLHHPVLGKFFVGGLESRGNKAQRQGVVCDQLQIRRSVAAEKGSVEHVIAGNQLINCCDCQQNAAAKNRRWDQRLIESFDGLSHHIGCQQAEQQNSDQIEAAPYARFPKIFHFHFPQ